jgi:hypothetical protein
MEQRNRQPLCHDGGKLLIWLVKRLSIPRESWVHTYCFFGQKKQLPTKKLERRKLLVPSIEDLKKFIEVHQPCVVVGMGQLACECFTGASLLKKKAGTSWDSRLMDDKVWISQSTDAALFDPQLAVPISRVLGKAAMQAGINIKLNTDLTMFDWSNYL